MSKLGTLGQASTATDEGTLGKNAYVAFGADLFTMQAEAGSYAVSGADANLLYDRLFDAEAGSYSVTGSAATLFRDLLITAEGGTYSVSGQDADLLYDRLFDAESGSYAVTGSAADLERLLIAEAGSYDVSGQDATLLYDRVIVAESGSYSVSGSAATLFVFIGSPDPVQGNAQLEFDDASGQTTRLQLNFPLLLEVEGADQKRRSASESLDGTVREVYVTGEGRRILAADMRLIDTPGHVMDMLEQAADGQQIDYLPDGSTKLSCYVVNPQEAARLQPDEDRRGHGEYQTRIRLRRADAGDDWSEVLD